MWQPKYISIYITTVTTDIYIYIHTHKTMSKSIYAVKNLPFSTRQNRNKKLDGVKKNQATKLQRQLLLGF